MIAARPLSQMNASRVILRSPVYCVREYDRAWLIRMAFVHHLSRPRLVPFNRRAAIRVPAHDLRWLQGVRLADAPVTLVDLSLRGGLFEMTYRVRPGDRAELELFVDSERTISSSRVVRCEVAEIQPESVRYRGAFVFASPLPWSSRLPVSRPADPPPNVAEREYEPRGGWSDVVVQCRYGGRQLRGYSHNFQPSRGTIELWPSRTASAAQRHTVPLALVRAVQVLRDLGDGGVPLPGGYRPRGTPVEVAFKNNQLMRAIMPSYDSDAIGFWLLPIDPDDSTRVFAIASAVAEIRVLYPG